ncbi:NDP-sugar synthase [soil metagenome]
MRAVVLVGGFGTRLRPLTAWTPKQMLPVVHRPMIEWVVAHLAEYCVDDVVLSLGYRPDAFRAAYPGDSCAGATLHYAVEPEPLDTAGAIGFAATSAGIDERFLVVNGDVLTDLDIGALVEFHAAAGAEATIALHRVGDPSMFGVVSTDDDGRVLAFVEKPPPGQAPTDLINAGTYVLEPSVLERIVAGRRVSIERETFPSVVAARSLYARHDGGVYWIDAGTPAQYLQVQLDLIDGRRGPSPEAVHRDALVATGARVARSVLEAGVTVATGAEVRNSVVLAGATIEAGALLADSIVAAGAVVGRHAVVEGCSVVGEAVTVPDGQHLTGARVPEPA